MQKNLPSVAGMRKDGYYEMGARLPDGGRDQGLEEAAVSLKRDLKYEKRQDTDRKQNRKTKGIKWAARV